MIRYKAKKFKEKYELDNSCSPSYLKFVIHKRGHNVCTYTEEILKLTALKLNKEIKKSPAISLEDDNGEITVYYNDDLPENVQCLALAHEIGHIELGHIRKNSKGQKQEREADEFANIILSKKIKKPLFLTLIKSFLLIPIMCIFLVILSIFYPATNREKTFAGFSFELHSSSLEVSSSSPQEHSKNIVCYYSKYGEVYHLYSDCYHLKNSKSVFISTIDKCKLKRVCSVCERRSEE